MDTLDRLSKYIDEVPLKLSTFSEDELTQHAPGKWSRKEILGHLIDSAINNLKRFTDAQFAEGVYQVLRYNQNQLVVVNYYQSLPLKHLLTLWSSLNSQILFVASAIPADTLAQPIQFGETSQLAASSENRTLGWLIEDYVVHLEHHLKTLL